MAKVISVKGQRMGRGFSYGELKSAKISLFQAKQMKVIVDSRRRSTHDFNVDELSKMAAKLPPKKKAPAKTKSTAKKKVAPVKPKAKAPSKKPVSIKKAQVKSGLTTPSKTKETPKKKVASTKTKAKKAAPKKVSKPKTSSSSSSKVKGKGKGK